jgi:acetyl-CoA carboxylase biotin carboxyl carrier protein
MDLKEIQALIKFVSVNGVDEVEINQDDFKLVIKKNPVQYTTTPVQTYAMPAAPVAAFPTAPAATPATVTAEPAKAENADNLITIKSPMVGTFYRASSPETPSFVNVGDEVASGKVVCIIEAMKLFNEIESEVKGRIVKVLVDNATPVEYDQPLFLVEPM